MKITFLLGTLLFFNATFAQNIVESKSNGLLEFVELDYGLASVKGGTVENVNNTPTGTHGWLKDFVIVKVTDSVEAVLKANFGTVYIVKAKDTVEIDVVIEWIYPSKVTNDKGEKFKSIKYTTKRPTNIPSASSYSLDASYELVKGIWKQNIYLENKKVYTRTFILY